MYYVQYLNGLKIQSFKKRRREVFQNTDLVTSEGDLFQVTMHNYDNVYQLGL